LESFAIFRELNSIIIYFVTNLLLALTHVKVLTWKKSGIIKIQRRDANDLDPLFENIDEYQKQLTKGGIKKA